MDQPLARLAFYLLEPTSDDGLVAWNYLDDRLKDATHDRSLPDPQEKVMTRTLARARSRSAACCWRPTSSAQSATFKAPPATVRRSGAQRKARDAPFPRSTGCSATTPPRAHVPGAAWGIVIDGELAHTGVLGYRDAAVEVAGDARHGVPHRVDDQELHRDGDPEAARRREAVARRSRGEVRAGDEGARLSDERLAENHDPPPAVARRGISRRQPVGRPAARRHRRTAVGADQGRHSVLQRAGRRLRVLELRLRDSRPHRRERRRAGSRRHADRRRTREYIERSRAEAARDDVDDARAVERAGRRASRTAIAGKTSSGRTSRCSRTDRSDRWAAC